MDDIQARQCGHKLKFTDIEQARRSAKSMHKRNKARYTAYACRWCEHWHVGTVRSPEAAQRRAERRTE